MDTSSNKHNISDDITRMNNGIARDYYQGVLPARISALIKTSLINYKFTPGAFIAMFDMAKELDPSLSPLFIESLVIDLYHKGWTNHKGMVRFHELYLRSTEIINLVERNIGVLNLKDYNEVMSWAEKYNATTDLVSNAIEMASNDTNPGYAITIEDIKIYLW